MARWTEQEYLAFLKKSGVSQAPKPKGRSASAARMTEARFNEIIKEDPRQGRGIRFELDVPPIPKRSARVFIRNGKVGSYIPKATRKYMNYCKTMASIAMSSVGQPAYRVTVKIDVLFCFRGEIDELPTHPSDGDLDNLEKAIYDSMSKVVYSDDKLISGHKNYKICISDESKIIVVVTPMRPSDSKFETSIVYGPKVFLFEHAALPHKARDYIERTQT